MQNHYAITFFITFSICFHNVNHGHDNKAMMALKSAFENRNIPYKHLRLASGLIMTTFSPFKLNNFCCFSNISRSAFKQKPFINWYNSSLWTSCLFLRTLRYSMWESLNLKSEHQLFKPLSVHDCRVWWCNFYRKLM